MKPKVLIVDDEETLTSILCLALEDMGHYEVQAVTDPHDAVPTAQTFRPDVVVLDIIMPQKNGLDVADDMKADPELADIPIIFLSATAVKRESGAWLNTDEGMYKKLDSRILEQSILLEKPVTTEGLVAAIESKLGSH